MRAPSSHPAALAVLLALASPGVAAAEDPSQLLDTPEFSIRIPAGAERTEESLHSPTGDVKVITWLAQTETWVVGVSYADFPQLEDASPEERLDGVRDGMLGMMKASLTTEVKVSIRTGAGKQWPGRSIRGEGADGSHMAATFYGVGLRLYEVLTVYKGDHPPAAYDETVKSLNVKRG